jgi:hypothetical protein
MRFITLPAVAGLAVILAAAATSSEAGEISTLEASAGAGACGGSEGCSNPMDIKISPATNATVDYAHDATTLVDGSYANAQTTATFGALHVYADAFRASGSDAQSHADAKSDEYIPAAKIQNGVLNQFFYIDGSIAPGGDDFGNVSQVYFQTLSYDVANGHLLDNTTWESTLAKPTTMIPVSFAVPAGHDVQNIVELSAFAYSSFGIVDYVDYKDTLHIYMTTGTPGFDVVGLSGRDYAPSSAVPEPASWAVMLIGFGLAGGVLRRRASATA